MRQASTKVLELIGPVVDGLGYEFVGAEYLPQGKHSILRVYIDVPETGVTVEDCEKVSRQLSSVLDVEDLIPGQYALEISSPGLDRPLFSLEHFERFAGQEVKLRLSTPLEGKRKLTAILSGVEDGMVKIEFEGDTKQVVFEDIEQARLVPGFD